MSEIDLQAVDLHVVDSPRDARIGGEKTAAVVTAATYALYLAAMPTFAIMAVLTSVSGENANVMCPAAHGAWPLGGMVPMYVLMSAFHSAPWLKWILRPVSSCIRSSRSRRSCGASPDAAADRDHRRVREAGEGRTLI